MNYEQWELQVPAEIREDPAWNCEAYRLGLFFGDLADRDAAKLWRNRRTWHRADQLSRAADNISSNIIEGFSRGTGKDRARFYEYSLGSARECRDWYYKARSDMKEDVVDHRVKTASRIIRLLLTMVRNEQRRESRVKPRRPEE